MLIMLQCIWKGKTLWIWSFTSSAEQNAEAEEIGAGPSLQGCSFPHVFLLALYLGGLGVSVTVYLLWYSCAVPHSL